MRTGKIIEQLHHLCDTSVVPAYRKGVRQLIKQAVPFFIISVQNRCYDLLPQQKGLIFFQNPEIGRNAQLVKIFTDKLAAKAMDSTDMGSVQKNLLALQMNVVRLLLQQGADLPGYPRPHLGGSSLCKGDHQKPVRSDRMQWVCQPLQQPLYQNTRLTRTRGS